MRKKRPFLLLEVLIAFTLVSLFLTFYLQQSFSTLKESHQQSLYLEKSRIADLCFIDLKRKLWRNEISWDELDDSSFSHEATLSLPHKEEEIVPLTLSLSSKEKETNKGLFKKVSVQISFRDDTTFSYLVVAKKA